MLFSSCAILWRVLSVCRPYPWYFAGFPIDDVFRNWGVGRSRELDVGRLPLDEDGTCCELFTATGGHSFLSSLPPLRSTFFFLHFPQEQEQFVLVQLLHIAGSVWMCLCVSVYRSSCLLASLSVQPSIPLFLVSILQLLSITATKMFPLLS